MTISEKKQYRFRSPEFETRFRIELITKIRSIEGTLYRRSLEPFVLRTRRIGFRGWRFENRSVRSVEARVWASAFPRGRSVSHRYLSQNKDVWTWNISKNRELKLNHLISKKTHFKPESYLEPRITVPFRSSHLV